jgi:uncharacterized protein with HEPN domain
LPSEKPVRRFQDILDNIERIERFTAGMDLANFVAQEHVVFAVLYALLVISEAARKLGEQADRLAPDQPWADIASIGNVLRHQYDDVEPEVIWWIVQRDLVTLKSSVQQALAALSDEGPADPSVGP